MRLAEALVSEGSTGVVTKRTRKGGRYSKSYENKSNVGDHLPEESRTRRRYQIYSHRKPGKPTKILCRICILPLCIDCFTLFHT